MVTGAESDDSTASSLRLSFFDKRRVNIMIVCQTITYKRRQNDFTSAEQSGGMVAHHELVRAALANEAIDGVHFFLSGQPEDEAPLASLQNEFRAKAIAVHPLACLGELSRTHQYVFPVAFESLPMLAAARLEPASGCFPVSGIVHSISSQASAMLYISMLALGQSFDRIVVTSESGKRAIETIFNGFSDLLSNRLQAPFKARTPVVKIPLGVDESFLRPCEQRNARERTGLPSDKTILLYIGRFTEEYKADLEPLLIALRQIYATNKQVLLVLAGADNGRSYKEHLARMCSALGLEDAVIFKTNFSHDLKPFLYSSADIFVSPVDNIQETFGLSLLEAAACGLPVVASDWSGYRDLVEHGTTGLLVPTYWDENFACLLSESAHLRNQVKTTHRIAQRTVVEISALSAHLQLLISHPELRRNMGARGRERVIREFRWSQIMSSYIELWKIQWDELRRQPASKPVLGVGLNEIYGHFASNRLETEAVFEADFTREIAIDEGKPVSEEMRQAHEIWSACATKPSTEKQLARNGIKPAPGILAWLWKKGYLRRRAAASS